MSVTVERPGGLADADPPVEESAAAIAPDDRRSKLIANICSGVVFLGVLTFVNIFSWYSTKLYRVFGQYGFDTGIFSQGTWLLSQLKEPFITIRGLNLFGDHASFILAFVAPFYRIWPDPRLLFILQAVCIALPAVAIYKFGLKRIGHVGACAVAIAYLFHPAVGGAASWQFHPETIATAFLAFAVLAYDTKSYRRMYILLGFALICKEDIALVVMGFGALVFLLGHKKMGGIIAASAGAYFFLVTFVVMRMINGQGNLYFERNYGIEANGPVSIILAIPQLVYKAGSTALTGDGMFYLWLVLGPLALLPLLGTRWMLPVAGPLLLNLASNIGYQRTVAFQYLATSCLFLAFAAVVGLAIACKKQWLRLPVFLLLPVVSIFFCYKAGPWEIVSDMRDYEVSTTAQRTALSLIPKDAGVSALYNIDAHLAHRERVYEFPNPFKAANWGIGDAKPTADDIKAVEYVLIQRSSLGPENLAVFRDLESDLKWVSIYDDGDFVVLHLDPTHASQTPEMTDHPAQG